ncbi:hypothetical protein ACFL5Z_06465 [Planctomycetota bacterium]
MDRPNQFMLQSIRRMLKPEGRKLFLKKISILDYLGQIGEDEETELELGDYPAVEALAFAVLEGNWKPGITLEQINFLEKKYLFLD